MEGARVAREARLVDDDADEPTPAMVPEEAGREVAVANGAVVEPEAAVAPVAEVAVPDAAAPTPGPAEPAPGPAVGVPEGALPDVVAGPPRLSGPGDPADTARALALCVAEILTGAREVDSIARWITEDVHRHLQQRAAYAARARSATRHRLRRASIRVGTAVVSRPTERIAEVSVVVHTRSHARAVAIRLEVRSGRWRATAVAML